MTRLNLLRLNTMPELDVRLLEDLPALRGKLAARKQQISYHSRKGRGPALSANQDLTPGRGSGRVGAGDAEFDNAQLRELGRLPYPMLRVKGAKGFRRISWDEACRRIAQRIRATDPKRWAMSLTSRGITNEVYYMAQKVARFLG